jgi:hypothetical protein
VEEDQDYSFDLQEQNLELAFDEFGDVEAEIEWLKQENKILGIRYNIFPNQNCLSSDYSKDSVPMKKEVGIGAHRISSLVATLLVFYDFI